MNDELTKALKAEDARQAKLHELLETIREQIRLEVLPEHRPEGLFQNIQNAVYAMRGRTPLMNDAVITSRLAAQPAAPVGEPRDGPCFYCGEMTSSLAGNPGKWPLIFCQPDGTGSVKYHHTSCVVTRLRAAAPPPCTQKVGEWQPIATAPKDGTHILAYRQPIGMRVTNLTNPPTVVHWFDDPEQPGFYTSVNERAPEYPFNPTHWKPLGPPPALSTNPEEQKTTTAEGRMNDLPAIELMKPLPNGQPRVSSYSEFLRITGEEDSVEVFRIWLLAAYTLMKPSVGRC